MKCPPAWRLAAAASGEDAIAAEHAEHCLRCAPLLVEQRGVHALARRSPTPVLRAPSRSELAAEVMAHDLEAPSRSRRATWLAIGAAGLAAAATIALVARRDGVATPAVPAAPAVAAVRSLGPPAPSVDIARPVEPPAPAPTRAVVVPLHDGELALDSSDRGPVSVVANGATVAIAKGRARLSSRGGVIVAVRVFAGSVELIDHGKTIVVAAGDVWVRPVAQAVPPEPTTSLALFRTGWEALHAGRNGEALDAFDRAIDPMIAEDATFWAAIAADRSGDHDGATHRLRVFLEKFPESPRADDARAMLVR